MGAVSLRFRLRRARLLLAREASRALGTGATVYVDQRVDEYRAFWSAAADLLGARFEPLSPGVWEVRRGSAVARVAGHVVSADDPVTLRLAGDKGYCLGVARDAGVPVPEHHLFGLGGLRAMAELVARDPGPWVVKPARGSASGLGVTTGVTGVAALEAAAALASLQGPEMLLERMVPGESCRLLFLDGELIHAVRRRGVRVTGDGRSTVARLAAGLGALPRDAMVAATLAAQGLTPASIPRAGRSVLLHGTPLSAGTRPELRTIYDESIEGLVAPDTVRRLAAVVARVGSRFAGVDLVCVDPGTPLAEVGGAFLELNTTPGIHHHYHTPLDRERHPVAVRVLRRLLDGRDPPAAAASPPRERHPMTSRLPRASSDYPLHTADYLRAIGVEPIPAALSPFDPGYDPVTLDAHLQQSGSLMSLIKISMACWLVANESATRCKVASARRWGVPAVTGGGPFEIAVQQGALDHYLDLCADLGFSRVECGEGFTDLTLSAETVMDMVRARGLEAQFELGKKHGGAFTDQVMTGLIEQGRRWLGAGAVQLVVEARESACGVGLFDDDGTFNAAYADRFADAFGLDLLIFEAPNKPSQFALLDHFGPAVHLCNVRLEEVLRVEIYRRGLHSDAFQNPRLRPPPREALELASMV